MSRTITLFLAALWVVVAGAASAYPDKPIRYIVPFPAGGVSDLLARALAEEMSKALGQRVVIENLPGASGIVASQAAARAAPDGYTLFQGETVTQVLNGMRKNKLPYDPEKAFEPITMLAETPMIIVVPAASPMKSFDDFVATVRATKGDVIFPSGGAGTFMHLTTEGLLRGFGAKGHMVAYTGTPRMIQDLMAGELAFAVPNVPSALPHLKSGALRALAVLSRERWSNLPDVPTVQERLSGFAASNWYALYAPTGVPAEIIRRVGAVVNTALKDEALVNRLVSQGFVLRSGTPADMKKLEAEDRERLAKVVAELGITLE